MQQERVSVMIVDDHFMIRMGLRIALEATADVQVVCEASTGQEAIDNYPTVKPTVVLLDMRLPDMTGIDVIREIRTQDPSARIVMLSVSCTEQDAYLAEQAGAAGYIIKTIDSLQLIQAIGSVANGQKYFTDEVARLLEQRKSRASLTPREIEVMELLANGYSNNDIASELKITARTAKLHVGNVLQKLNASDRTQAVIIALARGLVDLE